MENSRFEFRAYCPRTKQLGKVVFMNYKTKTCGFYGMTTHSGRKIFERSFKDVIFMQYTGLLDKQGVEVYEGDIVEAMQEYELGEDKWYGIGEVEFYNGSFVFRYKIDDSLGLLTGFDEIEVIGNIYEHSYLLGENK